MLRRGSWASAKTDVYESLRQPWGSLGGVAVADMSAHNFGPGGTIQLYIGQSNTRTVSMCYLFALF